MTKTQHYDLIVIGAGPAGMAASIEAAAAGASVLLLDEQPEPGGQIYRAINRNKHTDKILGDDYYHGQSLSNALQQSAVNYCPGATVWRADENGSITWSIDKKATTATAQHVIIATGASERPTPTPGWTLPGAITSGAAQILLKTSRLVAERAVIAGCGPLLYLLACQMIRAGCPPLALVETQGNSDLLRSLGKLPNAMRNYRQIAKGLTMLREIRAAGVARYTACSDIALHGDDCVTGITFQSNATSHDLSCEHVFLHQGIIPDTRITRSMRLPHLWDEQQQCFRTSVDKFGQTENPQFYVAGDGAAINGALAAELQGQLSAQHCCLQQQRITPEAFNQHSKQLLAKLARETSSRAFLDSLYPPAGQILAPEDATVICRCEEVTAGEVRTCISAGCLGPNQTKAFSRVGMGPCQGRYCEQSVVQIIAQGNGLTVQETGGYRIRSPLKPVTVAELASLHVG